MSSYNGYVSFNPRARVGRDGYNPRGEILEQKVSIHAPAWGATGVAIKGAMVEWQFQSTRPRGARLRLQRHIIHNEMFQSTRPRGARRADNLDNIADGTFQSTRPRGARRRSCNGLQTCGLFQSTRPRGARRGSARELGQLFPVSIHAPAWGATYHP